MRITNPSIANIGGGFTGSTITAMQVHHALDLFEQGDVQADSLTIRVIDQSLSTRPIGPGGPYSHGSDIFLLNQPAYAMSPFADDPDHFTRWLSGQGDYTQDSFAPRSLYGRYLQTIFNDAVQCAQGTPVHVEQAHFRATNIIMKPGSFGVVDDQGLGVEANAVVVGDGHQSSSLLREFAGHERYFSNPYDIDGIAEAAQKYPDRVGIVGTSQSMIDALTVLKHVGYQGEIYCFSRNLVMPWKLDAAALRRKEGQAYKLKYLTAGNVQNQSNKDFNTVKSLLDAEIAAAKDNDFNPAHVVLAAFDAWEEFAGFFSESVQRSLHSRLTAIYGNPTSPLKFSMMSAFQDSGQLSTIRMAIDSRKVHVHDNGIDISEGGKFHRVSLLFNAANVVRSVYAQDGQSLYSPVLNRLKEQNILKPSQKFPGAVQEGLQLCNGIWVAGPMTRTGKWGVGTFRPNNAVVARDSVGYCLGLSC